MNTLDYLVLHCFASPEGREYTKEELAIMHFGPRINKDGTFTYKRKTYNSVAELPEEKIGSVSLGMIVKMGGGHGWNQFGYNDLLHLDGTMENLVPYDDDQYVQPWELTNGILYSSSIYKNSRHMVYVGGMNKQYTAAKDTRTAQQLSVYSAYIYKTILTHPQIKVIGHNQINDDRACPSFSVPKYLRSIDVPEKNIAQEPVLWKEYI